MRRQAGAVILALGAGRAGGAGGRRCRLPPVVAFARRLARWRCWSRARPPAATAAPSAGRRPRREADAGRRDALGLRPGADREAADAAPDRQPHRPRRLRQPGGAARRCRGCSPDAHFASVIRAPAFVEAVAATLADGEERRVRFTAHQGRERFFEARVALLPPDGAFGPEALAIVQIEDRTETRRAEQLRSDFIANASHELRTPLASIIGYIETLQNHARDDAEARERFLAIMAREAGRMQRLVDDLMSLSRIEMTEHVRPVEECSLNQIAAESAAALLPVARQQGVTLEIDLAAGGALRARRPRPARAGLHQPDRQRDEVRRRRRDRAGPRRRAEQGPSEPRTASTVEDDGPGIPREHLHRLTERFYRVDAASSRNKGGTGLGLAIVKHILNRHEGRLEIASTLGRGQRLHRLAAARAAGPATDACRPTAAPLDGSSAVRPERACAVTKTSRNCNDPVALAAILRQARRLARPAADGNGLRSGAAPPWRISCRPSTRTWSRSRPGSRRWAGSARSCSSKALESVQGRDAALAREVIERDRALDAMEMALEESVVKVIALRQPVAADLRVLIAAMKIASTLERIGDLAKNIAKRAIPL